MRLDSIRAFEQARKGLPQLGSLVGLVCLLFCVSAPAAVIEDLGRLRDQCLYYAAGHAPTDTNTITLRHGLYAQSPFSATGEVDLAASGFSLAALPAAVANGVISFGSAREIASQAARQVRLMVERSAGASTPEEVERYGRYGLLCHYPVWDAGAGEFRAQPGVEFSSIDTTLLMYGLLVSGNYFGGQIRTDYEAARDAIRWRDLLDRTTPGHRDQFHMSYRPGTGFFAWWDWCTQEAMLVCVFAAMSDEHIQPASVWRAWRRDVETYTSPGPDPKSFTCCASYFGDPFTSLYGMAFLDFGRFPRDLDGLDWFRQGQTAYQASVEFFKKERGYLDCLSSGFSICAPNGFMSKPNGNHAEPVERVDATVYTLAGGLSYYGSDVASNPLASTLSSLVTNTPGFFGWHGWPAPTVNATTAAHEVLCDRIVGQDISFIGLALDNYLTRRAQNLVLQDPAIRGVLSRIFPHQGSLRTPKLRCSDVTNQAGADGPGPAGAIVECESEPAMDGAGPGVDWAALCGWACAGVSRPTNSFAQALRGTGEVVFAGATDYWINDRGASVFRGQHGGQPRTDCGAAPGDYSPALTKEWGDKSGYSVKTTRTETGYSIEVSASPAQK